jgi:hypothetical protein
MQWAGSIRRIIQASVLAGLCLPALASQLGSFQKTYSVSGPVDLEVLTHSGDVNIRTGAAGTVTVSGRIVASEIHVPPFSDRWFNGDKASEVRDLEQNPPVTQNGNSIHIDYVKYHNIAIDFEITVPADTTLRTRTGSGDQMIEGLQKGGDLEAGSGDIELRDLTGDLHIRTGSGDVRAEGLAGSVDAEAGSGDIRLDENGQGDIQVHTGSGNIEIRRANGQVHAEAGSGDITVDGRQAGEWHFRTGSGDVSLHLSDDAAFDLDASTSSGDLDVSQPVTMTVQGRIRGNPKTLKGTVRGGGALLSIHTGSGDIRID